MKLSPSSIKLMEDCPRCFWLTKRRIWKRPGGIFSSLPSGIDLKLKDYFDKFIGKDLPRELESLGKKVKLLDSPLMKDWRNPFKGISFTEGENTLFGAVDNILVKGEKLIVLDYKTRGFPLKENTCDFYKTQLEIYTFLLKRNGYKTEDYAYLLFYIPKLASTELIIFDTILKKVELDTKNAEVLWKKAIKLLNSDCPKKCCEWCQNYELE